MTVEDLLTKEPYEPQPNLSDSTRRRRHLIGIRTQTASPLNDFVDQASRMIDANDATEAKRPLPSRVAKVFVATPSVEALRETQDVEQSSEPGAPSASILLTAVTELCSWLSMTQQQVANFIGISPSTIMSWRRSPSTHPRHPNIPTLLGLWAAVAGARDELGEAATLQLVWGSQGRPARGAITMGANELAEKLIESAEASSLAAFDEDDGYHPSSATRPATGQIAADEESLSRDLDEYIMGTSEPTAE